MCDLLYYFLRWPISANTTNTFQTQHSVIEAQQGYCRDTTYYYWSTTQYYRNTTQNYRNTTQYHPNTTQYHIKTQLSICKTHYKSPKNTTQYLGNTTPNVPDYVMHKPIITRPFPPAHPWISLGSATATADMPCNFPPFLFTILLGKNVLCELWSCFEIFFKILPFLWTKGSKRH